MALATIMMKARTLWMALEDAEPIVNVMVTEDAITKFVPEHPELAAIALNISMMKAPTKGDTPNV